MPISPQEMLTTADVAAVLRIGTERLRQMRRRRRAGETGYLAGPPYHQLGPRKVLYSRPDVRDWLRAVETG